VTASPPADHSDVVARWNLGAVLVGLALVAVALLFPPYHLSEPLIWEGRERLDCTVSVFRLAALPAHLQALGPTFDSLGFWRRLALVAFATLLALRRMKVNGDDRPFAGARAATGALLLSAWVFGCLLLALSSGSHPGYTISYPDDEGIVIL